jgi:ribose transport system substrate-binding protein
MQRIDMRRLATVGIACAALALSAAACSSSGGSGSPGSTPAGSSPAGGGATNGATTGSSSGTSEIDSLLAKAQAPISFTPPGEQLDVGTSLKGKSVWYVQITSTPQLEVYAQALKDASAVLGIEFHSCNAQATPTGAAACLNQAGDAGAAAVIGESISTKLAGPALQRLNDKGIPVVYADNGPPSIPDAPKESKLLSYVTSDQDETNKLAVLSLIQAKNGEANILFPYPHGVQIADAAVTSVQQAVTQYCPKCTFTPLQLDLTAPQNWASAISAALLRDPDINAIAEFSDSFDTATLQGLRTAGKKLPVVSGSAKLAGLQNVASGAVLADPGTSSYTQGWAYMDQAIRMILGKDPVPNYMLPVRLFVQSNVSGLTLTPDAYGTGDWFGLDAKALYTKNWGVSG